MTIIITNVICRSFKNMIVKVKKMSKTLNRVVIVSKIIPNVICAIAGAIYLIFPQGMVVCKSLAFVGVGISVVSAVIGVVISFGIKDFVGAIGYFLLTLDFTNNPPKTKGDYKIGIIGCLSAFFQLIFFTLMVMWFGVILILISLFKESLETEE